MFIEKTKADDQIFLEIGVESNDVLPNVFKLGLQEDAEIKAIIEESSRKLNEHKHKRLAELESVSKNNTDNAMLFEKIVEKKEQI